MSKPAGLVHLQELFICVCLWLCTIVVHNTALNSSDNLHCILQTIITAYKTSIGGEGLPPGWVILNNASDYSIRVMVRGPI